MAIIKVLKRENPYVQIDKIGVDDSNLSWEATGLLTYLIGRPNNWKINIAHLASVKKNKETSTRNALLELRKAKYCHYFEVRKSGKIVETFYLVFEIPTEYEEIKSNVDIELKEGEKIFYKSLSQKKENNNLNIQPEVENQQSAKSMENSLSLPKVEKPEMEKPKVENQALINIDIKNNRMNIKKNHEYDFKENDDNLTRIEELFKEFGIDFSIKHKTKIKELLQKNSVDFLISHFKKQYEILKKKENVKSIAAVMSKHLFNNTCEIDNTFVMQKEEESKKEITSNIKMDDVIETFLKLPIDKQEEIESEILKKRKEINPQIKKISTLIFYKMIASDIRRILIRESLIFKFKSI
ncbi:replication protein [Fusobacterium pseudoperiodonticum]|uniref:replication protein n=1 Tax=Fusobacterium pseudoperiodonticum TaxID=2663009 RepID=UPI000C1C0727|nr:replication protein [Fusobacterium pseudoperiodonticum]ATV64730.1 replication protein [Fusobacterium pseudoperiodonticum]